MNTALREKQGQIETLRGELKGLFDKARQPDGALKMDSAELLEVNRRNDELEVLGKAFDAEYSAWSADQKNQAELERLQGLAGRPALPGGDSKTAPRNPGGILAAHKEIQSRGFKALKDQGGLHIPDLDLKTLMSRTAGWDPEEIRNRPVVYSAQRPIQVTDLIPSRTTGQDAIRYMEETTFTNNAVEVTEGNTYGEAALALTERTQMVEKLGVWIPMTDEQLEDVDGIQGYLDNRLGLMIAQRLDSQILNGTGVTPNVQGILNKVGIQTQAKAGDVTPDAIFKAATKVRVTGRATPGAIVMHPTDWQNIRLLRTAEGVYIWGSPSDAAPERIWGYQVVQCDALTAGTAIIGDWSMHSELAYKRGLTMEVTKSHSTYFVEGKQALRADIRCVLVWYRPAAFCTVTGL